MHNIKSEEISDKLCLRYDKFAAYEVVILFDSDINVIRYKTLDYQMLE